MRTLAWVPSALCKLLLCSLLAANNASATPSITLTGGEKFVESAYGQWLGRVYNEAFRRLGYEFILVGYPSQRAIVMGDRGEVDGQVERNHDFNLDHPNLVRVEEPTNREAYSAYAARPNMVLQGWEGLQASEHGVVSRRGVGKSVEALSQMVPRERLTYVERPEQALHLLILGRAEFYVDFEPLIEEALRHLRKKEPQTYGGIYKAGEMAFTSHHAFLHNRHADLAKKLAPVLREMKREGLFEKLRQP